MKTEIFSFFENHGAEILVGLLIAYFCWLTYTIHKLIIFKSTLPFKEQQLADQEKQLADNISQLKAFELKFHPKKLLRMTESLEEILSLSLSIKDELKTKSPNTKKLSKNIDNIILCIKNSVRS